MINTDAIYPIYASYGAKENKHQLIGCTNSKIKLPNQLLSVTDKPAGYLSADTVWYPVIGCDVFDDFWCIWCIYPDDKASRGGMVKSQVALMPVEEAIKLNDLTEILTFIAGIDELPTISSSQLEFFFQSLILQPKPILIIENLLVFSTLINELWQGLWPQARRDLVCRVKLNSPQSVLSIDDFEVIVSIKSRALQWKSPYIPIELDNISNNTNSNHDEPSDKAIKYLINRDDDTLKRLLESTLALNEPALKRLKKLSRTANLLDTFINEASTSIAIDLVRNILSFIDTENYWNTYLNEVLNYIVNNFSQINLSEAMRMRNLEFKKMCKVKNLSQALETYVKNEFTSWSEQDRYNLLIKIDSKENNWWYQSLKVGISKGINTLSIEWLEQAIELIVSKELSFLSHEAILNNIESELLERLLLKELDNQQLNLLKDFSNAKRWPKIYAWCVYKLEESTLAFVEVLSFQNNNIMGFRYLYEMYGAKDSLIVFRSLDDSRILEYLMSMHELIEDLLQYLELEETIDKHILSIGYSNGISIPQTTVRDTELDKILLSASNGEEVYGLIASIADSEFKFNLAERTLYKLRKGFEWERLNNNDSNVLLDILSQYIVENNINDLKDEYVQKSIKTKYLNSKVAPKIINFLINWKADLSESEVMTILHYYTDNDWNSYGKILGEYISSRNWKKLSLTLYELRKSKPLSNEALVQCYELLPQIKKYNYLFSSKNSTGEIPDSFILSQFAEVCANLDDSESLQIIWENAGGKRRHLSSKGTHGEQWNKAIRKASKGKIEGGLTTLVDIILEEYPNNKELKYFKTLIDDRNI